MKSDFGSQVLAFFAWLIFTLLGKTWKYSFSGNRENNPYFSEVNKTIFCFWHSQILQLAYGFRNCDMTTIVSSSKDGDLAVAIVSRWGQDTVRGSSSRGGITALRQCVRLLKKGKNIVIVTDGPRGPKEIVKPGIAQIALTARAPVVPVTAIARNAWRLNSWDRFVIPKPFSKIEVIFHDPITIPDNQDNEKTVEQITDQIQKALS